MIFPNVLIIMLCLAYSTNSIIFTIQEIKERMPTQNNFILARFVLTKPVK